MYQQNSFQGNQSFGQSNRYQPAGFVQSQYQGQLKNSAIASPVTSQAGFQGGNQQQQSFSGQASQQFNPGFQNPVIAHTGLTAGQSNFGSNQPSFGQTNPVLNHAGLTAGQHQQQQFRQQEPSFQQQSFTNSQQPVISQFGFQAGQESRSPVNQVFQNQGTGQSYQSSQFGGGFQQSQGAITPQNPVYRATNAREQDGPVIQHAGYQAGQSTGSQFGQTGGFTGGFSNTGFQNRF
ncbi:hypothetical protein [Paenibacillus tarimensis]|uniref:hypothetical protein n=1 Tax=Paenibacillus tarimensis TaxID=416012 RepID=UPI001F2A9794|nr:hypothetical protein [Paenibacillus tarimensis]MCF2942179.1 hypothetical protein [Paenibacillus tarimensis]